MITVTNIFIPFHSLFFQRPYDYFNWLNDCLIVTLKEEVFSLILCSHIIIWKIIQLKLGYCLYFTIQKNILTVSQQMKRDIQPKKFIFDLWIYQKQINTIFFYINYLLFLYYLITVPILISCYNISYKFSIFFNWITIIFIFKLNSTQIHYGKQITHSYKNFSSLFCLSWPSCLSFCSRIVQSRSALWKYQKTY